MSTAEFADLEVARERPAKSPEALPRRRGVPGAELERHGRAAGYPRRAFVHLAVVLEYKRLEQPVCDKNAALRRSAAASETGAEGSEEPDGGKAGAPAERTGPVAAAMMRPW